MKLRIPPLVVVALFACFMFLLATYLPVGHFDFFGRTYLLLALCALALIIVLVSFVQFYRAGTTIDPRMPAKTSKLVTGGIYQYSRNPIYLALLLLLLAWGLYLGNAFNSLVAAGFVSYMNAFQIRPEEQVLEQKYQKEYRLYYKMVRRWF